MSSPGLSSTAGRIVIDGEEVADRRANFGYMFQKDLLFPWRTIRNNVAVGLEVLGVPKKDARAQAQAILDRFELGRFANKYPVQLSGGMRQRVALMRTLLCDREMLLLDEPFGALDALTRSIMQEWLLGIWENDHRTIIFITHDIEEAVFLSDRVLMMSARPGIIKDEIKIDLGRPRDHRIVTSPRFTELKKAILDQIYEESLKADRPD
jgi:ABC-type nitrate/sulfonate/bicarbonate transport system ATPase subunit